MDYDDSGVRESMAATSPTVAKFVGQSVAWTCGRSYPGQHGDQEVN